MYVTDVLKTFWRLQNVLVELEAAAPMTAFDTWHVHTHLFVAGWTSCLKECIETSIFLLNATFFSNLLIVFTSHFLHYLSPLY